MKNNLHLGIDEAGMGPVFGPLVVSGVVIEKKNLVHLKRIGVRDSKKFGSGRTAHQKRKEVWKNARNYIVMEKRITIDADLLDRHNMYDLHINACREILKELCWMKVETVYIEQLGTLKRKNFFSRLSFWHRGFVYEKEADLKYPSVSLASIGAKILRDTLVQKLCSDAGEEYVSGYANNATEQFLRKYFNKNGCFPEGTRTSRKWAPIMELLKRVKGKE